MNDPIAGIEILYVFRCGWEPIITSWLLGLVFGWVTAGAWWVRGCFADKRKAKIWALSQGEGNDEKKEERHNRGLGRLSPDHRGRVHEAKRSDEDRQKKIPARSRKNGRDR